MAQQTLGPSSARRSACASPCIRAGAAATVVRGHAVGPAAGPTPRKGAGEAMTGTSQERCRTSVTHGPGARREVTTQREVAARRANAGLPVVDREDHLHVHKQEDSPSRSHGRARKRAPARSTGAARCVAPAARTGDGRGAATSTPAWNSSTPSSPTSASPSSSDVCLRMARQRGSERARMRVTSPASWRRSVQAHMQVEATALRGTGRRNRVAARLAGTLPRHDEGLSRPPAAHGAPQQLRTSGPHVGPPANNEGKKREHH